MSLRITTASGSRQSNIVNLPTGNAPSNYVSLACTAVIDNRTGEPLTVMSSFFSSFDGLHLVIMDATGQQLVRQSYLFHQSPYSPTKRPFTLPPGSTTKELRFPIYDIPSTIKLVRLRLEGTLPGSAYSGGLTSNVVKVNIDE